MKKMRSCSCAYALRIGGIHTSIVEFKVKMKKIFFAILVSSSAFFQGCYLSSKDSGPATTESVSFETDVITIFTSKCATTGCHTGASPAGSLDLDVGNSDVATIYDNIQDQITIDDPATSPLLMKATNETSHGGGAILTSTSEEYSTILQWITDGAFNDDCTGIEHSFATNVTPIFTQCNGSGCHATTAPVLDADAFANITAADAVDIEDPASSSLLRKPLGLDTHSGGAIFTDANDDDYKTIFCWIKEDAAADN